ncbi:Clavaminate synthase-like protein [Cyphellophora attinorum]|uniref:Clavaminate synthase-like protein n=1 Tax=Cyphellophora attinorum TaxID=1664694 RepID=A0A0N1I0W6_9EURO|nr:Clavaminate synthase-like protein [Phialophora attinorum]KPI45303.1 Clavaminate synthase-like protein [Phialophora attinorum]
MSTTTQTTTSRITASEPEGLDNDSRLETFAIPGSRVIHGKVFPLGIRVKDGQSFTSAAEAASYLETIARRGLWNDLLRDHGALLLRGFPTANASDFDKVVKAFKLPQPHREIGLAGKRSIVTGAIKTANEEPPDVKFYYHSEYGRSAHFPGVLFFFSEIVPDQGGQTPLLSSLELHDRLKEELPDFLHDLTTKGVLGRQYFPARDDPEAEHIGWNWKDSYGFDIQPGDTKEVQRQKVEQVLKDTLQADAEWQPNDALHVLQNLPAIRRVASTGELSFFNGFAGVYGRARDCRALEPPYKGVDGKYHLPTTYGDGSTIPTRSLERLLELSDEIGFLVPWQAGDVAVINNYTVQHARSPWVGKRSLLASLWDGNEKFVPV